jgi:hypothetical protein
MKLSPPRAATMLSLSDVPSSSILSKISRLKEGPSTSWKPVSVDELSPSWYHYGDSYGLKTTDLLCLHSQVPWTMHPSRCDALARRLVEMLEQQEWMLCTILLAVFVRSELKPVVVTKQDYRKLEHLAQLASDSNPLDAPEAAGMTARLGRVLLDQLHQIAPSLSATAAAVGPGGHGQGCQ